MPLQYINPDRMNAPGGHYSHAVVANGFVFVSGQLPIAADGRKLSDASFDEQATQVLSNVATILQASGSAVAQLTQVRVYLTDLENWSRFNALYVAWAGSAKPARAVVPVPALHYGFALEIEAVALVG